MAKGFCEKCGKPECEYTKITTIKCIGCGRDISVLVNETATVVSGRCADCHQKYIDDPRAVEPPIKR